MHHHLYKSAQLTFWLLLIGLASLLNAQTITKGPYLADPKPGSISIRWETDQASETRVLYGQTRKLKRSRPAELLGKNTDHYLYEVSLSNLVPGMEYQYRVKVGRTKYALHHFKAPPEQDAPCRFAISGDSRSRPQIFTQIIAGIANSDPDFVLSMGDLVENGGNYAQWDKFYFEPAGKLISERPFISTLGDHEGSGDDGKLFQYFLFPDLKSDQLWYSFDYGMVHFISLDYRHADSPAMLAWFQDDIQASKARWNIVFMHRPAYNLGGHRSFWGNPVWPDLFEQYQIDVVFGGHSHIYERFKPVYTAGHEDWAITYITTGGAGAGLYEAVQHPVLAYAQAANHYVDIHLNATALHLSTYQMNGTRMDSLVIKKNPDGTQSKDYLKTAELRNELDIMGIFAGPISWALESPPLFYRPADKEITLNSGVTSGTIKYELRLSQASLQNYSMTPYHGELQAGSEQTIMLKIISKTNLKISGWGAIDPPLRLEAVYQQRDIKGVVQGKILELRSWGE